MSKKSIAMYVRVSSANQDLSAQEPDLKAWLDRVGNDQPVVWYKDHFTGRTMKRPAMRRLESEVRAGKIDTLVVWRLDRLGRTAREMLVFLQQLEQANVEFVSVRDTIDTGTAAGRLMRTILAGFAEYEREVIAERVRSGIAKAKADGKRWGGRKKGVRPALTAERLGSIAALVEAGVSKSSIARQLGISRDTLYRGIGILNRQSQPGGSAPAPRPSR